MRNRRSVQSRVILMDVDQFGCTSAPAESGVRSLALSDPGSQYMHHSTLLTLEDC